MEDLIIRGGTVLDGTGAPGFRADVAVTGDRITAVGDLSGRKAARELDAGGLAVAPGFFDAHCHSDTSFVRDSSHAAKLYQGITTEVCGQCGYSPYPYPAEKADGDGWRCASFADYARRLDSGRWPMGTNLAPLVGHGRIRACVADYDDRPVTAGELEEMKRILRRELEAGAWGMSLGLEYSPGCFASREELRELGAVVKEFDGLLTAHLRNEGALLPQAIEELLSVGRDTGVHVHVSHLKIDDFRHHGKAPEIWKILEDARAQGINVTQDMYPYTASSTGLTNRVPKWALEGGDAAVEQVLAGPRRQEVLEFIREKYYFNAERAETALISDEHGFWPEIRGKTLRQVAEELLHTDDYAEAAAEILTRTHGSADGIFFVMSEEDMLYFLGKDVSVCSDGSAYPIDPAKMDSLPHPRSYGAIAEFFRLAREKRLCTPEEAVRRVTWKAARMLGMTDRGLLKPGLAADITVFDPASIAPQSTYLDPIRPAKGVAHVVLNGAVALENGVQTDLRAGRLLRRTYDKKTR